MKYLWVVIDANQNWKNQVGYVAKKIKKSVAILSKLHHFLSSPVLVNLYYALVYHS